MKFCIMAAMCSNRGIGKGGKLPWPPLSEEFRYFMDLTSRTTATGRKCVNIRGRVTWQCASLEGKSRDVFNIVISRNPREDILTDPFIHKVVASFEEALSYVESCLREQVDTVWIMGGQHVYGDAILHPNCDRLYLTHVHGDFDADTYFPEFEDLYEEDALSEPDRSLQEEHGVLYEYKVYTPKRHQPHPI